MGDDRAEAHGRRVVQAPARQPRRRRQGARLARQRPPAAQLEGQRRRQVRRDEPGRGERALPRGADAGAGLAAGRPHQEERRAQLRREQPGDEVLPVQAHRRL